MVAKTSTARSLCHGEAGIRLVSFRFPPLQPSPVPWTIKQHARVRARRAGMRNSTAFEFEFELRHIPSAVTWLESLQRRQNKYYKLCRFNSVQKNF